MAEYPDSRASESGSAVESSSLPDRDDPPPDKGQVDDPILPGDDGTAVPRRTWPTMKRSLGVLKILILGGGTLAIFVIVGFLAFIWKSANEAIAETSVPHSTAAWRRLLNSGLLLQMVTLSSLAIRSVAGLQASILTQMLSSLVLECGGCSLGDLALLSLTRAETSGPIGGITLAIWKQRGPANMPFKILFFIVLVLVGAIQFSSTLLVTDIGPARILGDYNTFKVNVNLDPNGTGISTYNKFTVLNDYWTIRAPTYFRFAENQSPAVYGEDYYDTGPTARAFLPIDNSSQRISARSFAGHAAVFDARVACIRPRLTVTQANLSSSLTLEGNVSWSTKTEGIQSEPLWKGALSCSVATANSYAKAAPERTVSICALGLNVGYLLGGARPELAQRTQAFLLVNITADPYFWRPFMTEDPKDPRVPHVYSLNRTGLVESGSAGVWQSLRFSGSNVGIDVSLCFFNPNDATYLITADSTRDGQEPSLRWSDSTDKHASQEVRDFLGATLPQRPPVDRGQLRLHPPANWTEARRPRMYLWDSIVFSVGTDAVPMFLAGIFGGFKVPHRNHVGLFQGVMAHTGGNAALALQALFTTLMQTVYYDYLPEFDASDNVTLLFTQSAVIPRRWVGFYSFCAVFAAHLALVVLITAKYLRETRISLLGNAWHAVTQVVASLPRGREDLLASTEKTDDEVEKDLRDNPYGPRVSIVTSAKTHHEKEGQQQHQEEQHQT